MAESAADRPVALPRRVAGTHLTPEAYAGTHLTPEAHPGTHLTDQHSRWDEPALQNLLARLHAWDPTRATT